MTTAAEVIRAAIPGADDDLCDFILWNRTPFPFELTWRGLYKSASSFRRANENGMRLCDHCDSPALRGEWECEKCHAILTNHNP